MAAPVGVTLADSPVCLGAFADEHDLDFDLVSDMAGDGIQAYDLEIDIPELGLHGIANRTVYIVDEDGTVTYSWTTEDPTEEPPYDEIVETFATA